MSMSMLYLRSVRETKGTHFFIISDPTITRAPPVAHDGKEAKIGAKKTETKNIRPVTIAVMPVFPPSGENISVSGREVIGSVMVRNTHLLCRWLIR